MNKTIHFNNYKDLLENLRLMVKATNQKILNSEEFFSDNANFFTKSFIVTMCAYLESYLKDVLMVIVDEMNRRLDTNSVPYNLVKWSLSPDKRELKNAELKFEKLKLNINRKEIDDFISGNPYRTESLFNNFGINLSQNAIFDSQKIRLNSIIGKRNSIIHHNDAASDISLPDIEEYIDFFITYIENIDSLVINYVES